MTEFDKALQIKPDYSLAYFARGNAKASLDMPHDAIADYNETISLDAKNADAYYNRQVMPEK